MSLSLGLISVVYTISFFRFFPCFPFFFLSFLFFSFLFFSFLLCSAERSLSFLSFFLSFFVFSPLPFFLVACAMGANAQTHKTAQPLGSLTMCCVQVVLIPTRPGAVGARASISATKHEKARHGHVAAIGCHVKSIVASTVAESWQYLSNLLSRSLPWPLAQSFYVLDAKDCPSSLCCKVRVAHSKPDARIQGRLFNSWSRLSCAGF